ncbi:MAG: hypothetical protein IJ659_04075 [Alloprevotella sp.]|nr:hypothetical protein [Alloprevotella sp.]
MVQQELEQELSSLRDEAQLKLATLWKQAFPGERCLSARALLWLTLLILSGKLNLSGGDDAEVSKLATDFNSTLDEIAKYDALSAKQVLSLEQNVELQRCLVHLIDIVTQLYRHANPKQ